MNPKIVLSIATVAIVIGALVIFTQFDAMSNSSLPNQAEKASPQIKNTLANNSKINNPTDPASQKKTSISTYSIMETNGVKHIVPLDKIKSGGPPPDGIPSIDEPKFVKASEAGFVSNSDIVIGLEINGDARAYPLFILVWHEIVNDEVGGVPVAVTYCPLCYTNQVFERTINGNVVEFGTSGKLYNSNLVMYDRMTGSYWSQALGIAITGELTGSQLNIVPFDVISFGDWKEIHPQSLVLSTETGHLRSYGVDPYGNYYTDKRVIFPVENEDNRMHPKEIILGFSTDSSHKAYKQNDLEKLVVINDEFGLSRIMLVSLFDDNARAFDRMVGEDELFFEFSEGKILDSKTGSEWNYDGLTTSGSFSGTQLKRIPFNPGFWFEWVAFHPDTLVFGEE